VNETFGDLSFGEKILHKMLHEKRPLLSALADKAAVKNRVGRLIGDKHVVPTYSVIEHEFELDFEAYPREFALKPTHGSQAGILVHDQSVRLDKQLLPIGQTWDKYFDIHPNDLDRNQGFVKIMARRWLISNYRPGIEHCYQAIPRKIIVEKYLNLSSTNKINDFRFYTFHGEVKFFRAASGYATDIPTFRYDSEGSFLPIKEIHDKLDVAGLPIPELPKEWHLMKAFAEELSHGVDFVRVDFYLIDENIYFSELTNYPLAGTISFKPESFDRLVSSYWKKCDCCIG
jgi:TupA-like ATPgrasp